MKYNTATKRFQQQGAVLVISLIFMLLTAMIVGTLLTTSSTEMKMATNEQFRLEAGQKAESIIDNLFDEIGNNEEDGYLDSPDQRLCVNVVDHVDCIAESLLPNLLTSLTNTVSGESMEYYIEYIDNNVPGYTVLSSSKASSGKFGLYEMHIEYDASELGQGRASLVQGIMVSYGEGSDQELRTEDDQDLTIYRDINVES